jgi:mannose-6-phosphate isomerase-like protein (cupin superfamily)
MNEPQLHVTESDRPTVPDICGTAIDLINNKISSSKNISLGVVYISPGKSSTPHYHKVTEEIYYFLEGNGRVIIEDCVFKVGPGSSVYIPLGKLHQVINDSATSLKLLSADSPPYDTADIFTVS